MDGENAAPLSLQSPRRCMYTFGSSSEQPRGCTSQVGEDETMSHGSTIALPLYISSHIYGQIVLPI